MMKSGFFIMFLAAAGSVASCNQDVGEQKKKKELLDPSSVVHNPRTMNGIPATDVLQMPVMSFVDSMHSFGTITEGERVTYEFAFKNAGQDPLLIQGAEASCGCTVADYPRQPIASGKGGVIKVIFNSAGKQGHQEKDVAITANTMKAVQHLFIQADVTPESK